MKSRSRQCRHSGARRGDRIGWDSGIPVELWETSMRLPILTISFIAATAALHSDNRAVSAQSAYPWCAVYYTKSGTPMCYFATRDQCMESISGIGGVCVQNLQYNGRP